MTPRWRAGTRRSAASRRGSEASWEHHISWWDRRSVRAAALPERLPLSFFTPGEGTDVAQLVRPVFPPNASPLLSDAGPPLSCTRSPPPRCRCASPLPGTPDTPSDARYCRSTPPPAPTAPAPRADSADPTPTPATPLHRSLGQTPATHLGEEAGPLVEAVGDGAGQGRQPLDRRGEATFGQAGVRVEGATGRGRRRGRSRRRDRQGWGRAGSAACARVRRGSRRLVRRRGRRWWRRRSRFFSRRCSS